MDSALEIAKRKNHGAIIELLNDAIAGRQYSSRQPNGVRANALLEMVANSVVSASLVQLPHVPPPQSGAPQYAEPVANGLGVLSRMPDTRHSPLVAPAAPPAPAAPVQLPLPPSNANVNVNDCSCRCARCAYGNALLQQQPPQQRAHPAVAGAQLPLQTRLLPNKPQLPEAALWRQSYQRAVAVGPESVAPLTPSPDSGNQTASTPLTAHGPSTNSSGSFNEPAGHPLNRPPLVQKQSRESLGAAPNRLQSALQSETPSKQTEQTARGGEREAISPTHASRGSARTKSAGNSAPNANTNGALSAAQEDKENNRESGKQPAPEPKEKKGGLFWLFRRKSTSKGRPVQPLVAQQQSNRQTVIPVKETALATVSFASSSKSNLRPAPHVMPTQQHNTSRPSAGGAPPLFSAPSSAANGAVQMDAFHNQPLLRALPPPPPATSAPHVSLAPQQQQPNFGAQPARTSGVPQYSSGAFAYQMHEQYPSYSNTQIPPQPQHQHQLQYQQHQPFNTQMQPSGANWVPQPHLIAKRYSNGYNQVALKVQQQQNADYDYDYVNYQPQPQPQFNAAVTQAFRYQEAQPPRASRLQQSQPQPQVASSNLPLFASAVQDPRYTASRGGLAAPTHAAAYVERYGFYPDYHGVSATQASPQSPLQSGLYPPGASQMASRSSLYQTAAAAPPQTISYAALAEQSGAAPRLYRTRSDESLSMSETRAKAQEEKAAMVAKRELRALNSFYAQQQQAAQLAPGALGIDLQLTSASPSRPAIGRRQQQQLHGSNSYINFAPNSQPAPTSTRDAVASSLEQHNYQPSTTSFHFV